ncbi:Zn2 Cys6 DNA-binding protein [Fusarium mundagurra]|uniref:Zn2 Cys6 DNA-binding protein n=1 Tax=Fusarium mundagurra TaxID=1567541 RepID=A0A8H5YT20_9HYPO|nr:Zn2 Cys6 DNA-binding protein [Fusarium mundagurra]
MAQREQQQPVSDGTRSRKGCLTCRIRKKKCDEKLPACSACQSRDLACYGFNVPPPPWITNKASWKHVLESNEARALQTVAELRYRVSRKLESRDTASAVIGPLPPDSGSNNHQYGPYHFPSANETLLGAFHCDIFSTPSVIQLTNGINIWQRQPDTMWWDSRMRSLQPGPENSSREETRLLMLFLDVIHPITHTFCKLDSNTERNWMLNRLIGRNDLFSSALSVSACFEHSLTQRATVNEIGLSPKVSRLQGRSISILREEVERFSVMKPLPVEDFVWAGIHLVDVIAHLETLEIFSMLQGQWEVHHQAARKVLNHIETAVPLENRSSTSVVADVLSNLSESDVRRRSLQLSIFNFIWIDVLATSTFGAVSYCPCAFDYLPLLDSGTIRSQDFMGCQSQVFAIVSRIARLEQLQLMHRDEMDHEFTGPELQRQHIELEKQLDFVCQTLREDIEALASVTSGLDLGAAMISLIWAYGARVLLQVLIAPITSEKGSIDQTFVNICLEKLEALPTRLVMRTAWPYTITGCMAMSESQHHRFRQILNQVLQEAQAPGITWKGLIVMEECWRLRRMHPGQFFGWREAMRSLGARVILT